MEWPRVGAAALSLGVTSGLMVWLQVPHPPAGATTLIVSLGVMPQLWQIPVLMAAVVLLVAQAFVINRLAGIPTHSGRLRRAGSAAMIDLHSNGYSCYNVLRRNPTTCSNISNSSGLSVAKSR